MWFRYLSDVTAIVTALFALVMGVEKPDAVGAEKKAQVVAEMEKILDEPGGLDWPAILPVGSVRTWLIGFIVDQLVRVLKNTGFFSK